MKFEDCLRITLRREGGYVNDPADPGGETNFGISKRAYPSEDIKHMTLQRAAEIYRRDFWGPAGCDAVPESLRFHLFDCAVNSGVRTAVRLLQKAVGETEDGSLGPRTLQAVQSMPEARLAARFSAARLAYMAGLPAWPAFGRGWAQRIAQNLQEI